MQQRLHKHAGGSRRCEQTIPCFHLEDEGSPRIELLLTLPVEERRRADGWYRVALECDAQICPQNLDELPLGY